MTSAAAVLRLLSLAILLVFASGEAVGAVSRFSVGGNWSSTATWATACGGAGGQTVPSNGDTVTICANTTVTLNTNTGTLKGVTVQANGILNDDGVASRTFSVGNSNLVNSGTID